MLDDRVAARSGAMVLAGAMGVGKSRLLAGWLAALEVRDRVTIAIRATRSTATIPFGAFARWVPDQIGSSIDRLEALKAAAAYFAERDARPLLAVDDAQLLDEGSAALVLHLAQHTSLSLLVTIRSGEPCPDAVTALWKEGIAPRLDLAPLSEPQAAELLEQALGGTIAAATQRRLWQLTQGNPLYLREVVEAGLAQATLTRTAGVWRWKGALPVRSGLVDLISDRIGAGGSASNCPATRQALEMIALGEPLPVEVLEKLGPEEALVPAEQSGIVVVDRQPAGRKGQAAGAGDAVRLAHPLYSEVLRAELPPFTARSHHRALADAAIATGLHHQDPLRVATWLLHGGATPTEPDLLLRASFLAQNIDDYELSARLADAAEQAGGGWRATLRRAEALGALHRWEEADALLNSLSSPGSDPAAHAAAARVRAQQSFFHREEDISLARGIIAEAAEQVPAPARSSLLTYGARLAILPLELDEAIRQATLAVADADSYRSRLRAVTTAGLAAAFLGRTRAAMVASWLAVPRAGEPISTTPTPATYAAYTYSFALILDGRIDEAATFFEKLLNQEAVPVLGPAQVMPAFWLARAALTQGRVRTATRLCQDALDQLGDENHFGRGTWVAATLATSAAQAGQGRAAAAALEWADTHPKARAASDDLFLDLARAWLRALEGELSAARDLAVETARRASGFGAWGLEVLAWIDAVRLGVGPVAAPRLAELTQLVEGAYPATAARFAGCVASRDGAGLDEVADRFAGMGARLAAAEASAEAARLHEAEGLSRKRAASLANAQELAAGCEGATTPLLAQLDHEPPVAKLTTREREVIDLAARGRTSREIAETLFISVRTVDSHLNHAYTKLGISSRSELATVLGRETGTETGGMTPEP